jgi:hypothetical protein
MKTQKIYGQISCYLAIKEVAEEDVYNHIEILNEFCDNQMIVEFCINYYYNNEDYPQDMTASEYIKENFKN